MSDCQMCFGEGTIHDDYDGRVLCPRCKGRPKEKTMTRGLTKPVEKNEIVISIGEFLEQDIEAVEKAVLNVKLKNGGTAEMQYSNGKIMISRVANPNSTVKVRPTGYTGIRKGGGTEI